MNIVPPKTITDAMLTASTVPETDYSAWNSATAYVAGDRCIVAATHCVYEAIQAGTNQYPPDTVGGATPYWLLVGSTNRWRMFDGQVGTVTSKAEGFSVTLAIGSINTMALMEVDCDTVNISITSPGVGLIYSRTIRVDPGSAVVDWYTYYFSPVGTVNPTIVLTDIPTYRNAVMTITFSAPSGTASCGMALFGIAKTIGLTQWEPQISIIDYSKKSVDDFGNPTLVVRSYAKLLSADVAVETSRVGEIQRMLAQYRATPILWIGNADFESTVIYGFYRSFSIVISEPSTSDATLEVEGLI